MAVRLNRLCTDQCRNGAVAEQPATSLRRALSLRCFFLSTFVSIGCTSYLVAL